MRRCLILPLLLVAACKTGGTPPLETPPTPPPTIYGGNDGSNRMVRLSDDNTPTSETMPAPVDKVWPAMARLFSDMGLKIDQIDSPNHRLGASNARFRHTFAGRRLSSYFDCGANMTGQIADSHEVVMNVQMGVAPEGTDQSTAAVRITAHAVNMEGTSTDPVRCGSNGTLEQRMLSLLKDRVKQ